MSPYLNQISSRDLVYLNQAATKIQALFRGYRCRKMFWKERERFRREQGIVRSSIYRQDEYSLPSRTSIVENGSISALATNIDPNVGLVTKMPILENSQKNLILRELKSKITYSDTITTINQFQSESSPTIVLLGGINTNKKDYLTGSFIFIYNVQKNKWFFGGTMLEPRNYHASAYLNGRIYVIGGYNPLNISYNQMVPTQTVFQLTVRSKRWRKRADMHHARAYHACVVVNDKIMVIGGRDSYGKILSTTEFYDPTRDQWILGKALPEPLMGMGAVVLNGAVWVLGGIANEGPLARFAISNRVYAFDIEQQVWHRKTPLPEPRAFCCATCLKREIWVWCGVKETLNEEGFLLSTDTIFVYNPDINKWKSPQTVGTPKHAMACAKIGSRVYLLGGVSNSSKSKEIIDENDYYERENDQFFEGAPLPEPLAGATAVGLPIEYISSNNKKWPTSNGLKRDSSYDEAATKIQAFYRGYRTRSLLSNNQYPVYPSQSDIMHKGNRMHYVYAQHGSIGEQYDDKWKLFAPVNIPDWPPVPDIKSSSSHLNLALGTQPPGYTVTVVSTGTRIRRYVPLPAHADPNLALCGHLCNVYKKAKKVLGLRRVEYLPLFAKNMRTATQLQDDSVPVVLLLGGLQPRDPVNFSYGKLMLRYHTLKDRWEYYGVMPQPRNYHAAVYHRDFVYVTGGCDPDIRNSGEMVATNTTFSLNIHSNEWMQKAEMNCSRAHHGLIAAFNRLYAIGGRDHNGRLVASIECYDIDNDKWTLLKPMATPRMGMACAFYDHHIWVMGGIGPSEGADTLSYPILTSVISYDLENNAWLTRPPLRCPRAFGTCVVVNNEMWLCGGASKDRGHNYLVSMASVDKYYPEEAEWFRKTLICNPRHSAGIVAVESCIYFFGGMSSQEWSAIARNEMIVVDDISIHCFSDLPVQLTGLTAVNIPPHVPSLRSQSLALLLHSNL